MTSGGLRARACAARERLAESCSCLSYSMRRSSVALKVAVVLLHVIFVGALLAVDTDLVRREEPWYTALYLLLFVATLVQYFFTSASSPGYVIDAMRDGNETHATFVNSPSISIQPASRNGNSISSMDGNLLGRSTSRMNSSSWLNLVMDLYPPGSSSRNWTCTYCNIIQPPRSKHCQDCEKCVLQFDHHCVWLGTCIGQENHCRFWWYIFEETILSIWTSIFYISFLRSKMDKAWWEDFIVIVLLAALIFCLIFLLMLLLFHCYLVLTNQTTYELVRKRRILYLRGIPRKVHPFSKGICRNIYMFCCARDNAFTLEAVPQMEELEAIARPYTFWDIISCRCC